MTTETAFPEACWTGQPMTRHENVVCFQCKDATSLINLRSSAWFDPYLPTDTATGSYVHFKCLSSKRKHEIETTESALNSALNRLSPQDATSNGKSF